jgi:hypothetical protein
MHRRGQVLVSELRCTVADDDIAIGSVADRCLLSGVKQKSHFKGVRTVSGRDLMTRSPGRTAFFSSKQEVVSRECNLAMHNDVVARTERDRTIVSCRIKGRDGELTKVVDAQGSNINVVGAQV